VNNKCQYTPKTLTNAEIRQVAKAAVSASEFARIVDDRPKITGPVGGPWWLFRRKAEPKIHAIPENPWR
jgi:hypothetical protein